MDHSPDDVYHYSPEASSKNQDNIKIKLLGPNDNSYDQNEINENDI